jgi:hypothetical protein
MYPGWSFYGSSQPLVWMSRSYFHMCHNHLFSNPSYSSFIISHFLKGYTNWQLKEGHKITCESKDRIWTHCTDCSKLCDCIKYRKFMYASLGSTNSLNKNKNNVSPASFHLCSKNDSVHSKRFTKILFTVQGSPKFSTANLKIFFLSYSWQTMMPVFIHYFI